MRPLPLEVLAGEGQGAGQALAPLLPAHAAGVDLDDDLAAAGLEAGGGQVRQHPGAVLVALPGQEVVVMEAGHTVIESA